LTTEAAQATYDNACRLFYAHLEEQVIAALVAANRMVPPINTIDGGSASRQQQELYWIKNCLSLTNRNKHTLLHLAAIRGYDQLVRILVHLNCDVNQMDKSGFTALHFASWTGKVNVVKVLVGKTDGSIQTVGGKTARQLAEDAGHHGIVALFDEMTDKHGQEHRRSPSPSIRRTSVVSLSSSSTSSTSSTSLVRVPLIDILPSSAAVSSAKSILPDKLFTILSFIYATSANTPCVQQMAQSVSTVYTSMLDPF
jgi:hypothetical protein